jgi:hypothetical protein
MRQLGNNTVTCLVHPYNVEVRPLCPGNGGGAVPPALPVVVRLVRASNGAVVHSRRNLAPPLLLYGAGSSPNPLPDGSYRVVSSVGSGTTLSFTQSCPCSKGRKTRKGCRKNRRK